MKRNMQKKFEGHTDLTRLELLVAVVEVMQEEVRQEVQREAVEMAKLEIRNGAAERGQDVLDVCEFNLCRLLSAVFARWGEEATPASVN